MAATTLNPYALHNAAEALLHSADADFNKRRELAARAVEAYLAGVQTFDRLLFPGSQSAPPKDDGYNQGSYAGCIQGLVDPNSVENRLSRVEEQLKHVLHNAGIRAAAEKLRREP